MKRYVILLVLMLNFVLVYHEGKLDVSSGMEAKGQSFGLEWENVESWNIDQWEQFADEQGIPINEITPDEFFDNLINEREDFRNSNCPTCELDNNGNLQDLNFSVGNFWVLAQDLDQDGVLDYKYITDSYGNIIYSGSIFNYSDYPLTEDEDFIAWYEQNFGPDVPEEISDEVLINYYDDLITEQENTSNTGNLSTLTDQQKEAKLAQLVGLLNPLIMMIYGDKVMTPSVVFDPINAEGRYARAFFDYKSNNIKILPSFFNLNSDGDRISTLLHEYTHFTHSKLGIYPIGRDLITGNIKTINTNQKQIWTQDEYNYYVNKEYKEYIKTSLMNINIELSVQNELNRTYTYICSNFFRGEIDARKAELKGELDGLYTLTDDYRTERQNVIREFEWKLTRSINFERENKLNSNGE